MNRQAEEALETTEPLALGSEGAERAGSGAGAEATSRWGVLRHRHFRNVWAASFGSSTGQWMESIGIQWLVTVATLDSEWVREGRPAAALMLAVLGAAMTGPLLVLGLVGGVVADRVNRKRLLVTTQGMLMLIAAALTVASWSGLASPWFLIGVSLANGVVMAFNIPAWQVLTPRLVPRAELTRAIMLNGIQFNLARAVGPALGGVLLAQFGATVLFAVNTLSFVGVLGAIARTPDAPAPAHDGVNAWRKLREAFAFVLRERGPRMILLGLAVYSALAPPLLRFLPLLVKEVYRREEAVFGWLLGAMGLGAVLGGAAMRWVPAWYPKHHLIPLSFALSGLAVVGVAAAESAALAAVGMIGYGMFWMWSYSAGYAALQLLVDDRMRGRALAVVNTAAFGAMPLGQFACAGISLFVSGKAENGDGARVGIGLLAAVLVAAGLVMLTWRTPEVDGLKPGDPGHERRPGLRRGITASAHRPPRGPR